MELNAKTTVIDSDFRAGAIFFSLTNLICFSYALTNSVIYGKLLEKNNSLDGVNALAMTIISGIVTVISAILLIYSIYKLIMVREHRDKLEQQLKSTTPYDTELPNNEPLDKLRDIQATTKGPSPFAGLEKRDFRPSITANRLRFSSNF